MLDLFGATNPSSCYRSARTRQEFEAALEEPTVIDPEEVQVMEVHMDKLDVPWRRSFQCSY